MSSTSQHGSDDPPRSQDLPDSDSSATKAEDQPEQSKDKAEGSSSEGYEREDLEGDDEYSTLLVRCCLLVSFSKS